MTLPPARDITRPSFRPTITTQIRPATILDQGVTIDDFCKRDDSCAVACSLEPRSEAYALAAIAVLLVCLPLLSQTTQGTIQGTVIDQSGGAIAGATVTVIDVARGVTRALTTDGAGEYVATNLTPGTYTVRAEAKGFRTVEHSGVLVEVGQNIRVDLVIQPGEQTQTITVTGEVPAIDTTDATLGGTVSNESINALPLNGRNFQRLVQLRPGVVTPVGTGTGTRPEHQWASHAK